MQLGPEVESALPECWTSENEKKNPKRTECYKEQQYIAVQLFIVLV